MSIKIGSRIFDGSKPHVMGILNLTPDSFSDGGQYTQTDHALYQVEKMIQEGADIVDIGAESTRPGAKQVSVAEEIRRLEPVLKAISTRFDCPISLDTSKSAVLEMGISYGVGLLNDVTALRGDERMISVVEASNMPVVLMHMAGTPKTMQTSPRYENVVNEVADFFDTVLARCEKHGIHNCILDPGIGFGKTVGHNLALIAHLTQLKEKGYPILVGASRKSFIGDLTGVVVPKDRLAGSVAVAVMVAERGAQFIRVHDVRETVQALKMVDAIREANTHVR